MATYSHRELVVRRVEYTVPSGDAMGEFNKAYAAALTDWRQRNGVDEQDRVYDDWATVEARDDQVVITFTVTEETSADTQRVARARDALTAAVQALVMRSGQGDGGQLAQGDLQPIWDALTGPVV